MRLCLAPVWSIFLCAISTNLFTAAWNVRPFCKVKTFSLTSSTGSGRDFRALTLSRSTHSLSLVFFLFKFIALKMWVLFSLLSFTQSPSWIIAASHSQSSSFSPSPAFSFTMYVCVCATLTWSEATGRRENKRCPSLTAAPLPTGCSHRPSVCVCGFPRTGDN